MTNEGTVAAGGKTAETFSAEGNTAQVFVCSYSAKQWKECKLTSLISKATRKIM